MRAINLVTHCLACEGMDENNLKKYNLCESHSEKSNVRKDEEKDLKRFVSNSNFLIHFCYMNIIFGIIVYLKYLKNLIY